MSTSLSTIGDIKSEFLIRMNVATTVAYYTDTIVNSWIDQAHKMAAAYKKWPMSEGRVSTSYSSLATDEDGALYGVYPEGWKARAIRLLQIGGKTYDKRNFLGYKKFLDVFPSANDKIWTDYGLRYYINSGAQGSGSVTVWGQYTPSLDLTDPTATTIFTGVDEDGNQAIVELMMSFALTREKTPTTVYRGKAISAASFHMQTGQGILEGIWKRFTDEGFAYQTSDDDGMFKRIDIVHGVLRDELFKRDQFNN